MVYYLRCSLWSTIQSYFNRGRLDYFFYVYIPVLYIISFESSTIMQYFMWHLIIYIDCYR